MLYVINRIFDFERPTIGLLYSMTEITHYKRHRIHLAIWIDRLLLLLHNSFVLIPDLYDQMKMKFKISDEDLDILEEIIPLQQPYKAGKPWKFAGAFYYATTVLTTIGELTFRLQVF